MRGWMMLAAALVATPAMAAQPAGKTADLIGRAKRSVMATLKDAGSAQFRMVRKASDTDRSRVCGEVNAKNGYGGYAGFQKFVYFPDTDESIILDEDFPSPEYVREQAKLFGTCF
jgi:hypothetical protein